MGVYFLALGVELFLAGILLTHLLRWTGYGAPGKYTPGERVGLLGGSVACLLIEASCSSSMGLSACWAARPVCALTCLQQVLPLLTSACIGIFPLLRSNPLDMP